MNPYTLTQLKILVERAVRPVRASTYRTRKMREELLGHVTSVFEEESVSLGDEGRALERTQERFGSPAELTGQLQESVPASDRWMRFSEFVFVGAGSSPLGLVLRYALLTLWPGAILFTAYLVQDRMAEWPIAIASAVLGFGFLFLVDRMRDALYGTRGRSWRRVALFVAASWFLIPSVTFAVCWTFSGDWHSSLMDVRPLIPAALLTPVALISFASVLAVDARTQQEWASLTIV